MRGSLDEGLQQPDTRSDSQTLGGVGQRVREAALRLAVHRDSLIAALAVAVLLLPLGLAVVQLHGRSYAPIQDAALIEMNVRDVGSVHSPLVGAPGRMPVSGEWAHHPGPLAYYLLAPIYRLFGTSAWALLVATAVLNGVALSLSVWVGRRQAGALGALVVAVAMGILMQGYGLSALTEPWNPYYSVLWFGLFLTALWAVVRGDSDGLVVVVASGTFCAQAHVAYVAVCGSLGLPAAAIVLVRAWHSERDASARRRARRGSLMALLVLGILWAPPLLEELTASRGNLSSLIAYFGSPPESLLGFQRAAKLVLERADAWCLLAEVVRPGGLTRLAGGAVPDATLGGVFELVWLVCFVIAVRLRDRGLLALHGVHLAGTLVAVVATSRIVGPPLPYLLLWCWAFAVTLLVASGWTAVLLFRRVWPAWERTGQGFGTSVLVGAVVFLGFRLALTVPGAGPGSPAVFGRLAALVPPTLSAIRHSVGAATGPEGRYYIIGTDAFYGSALGVGLVNELDRAGIDARVDTTLAGLVGEHRTMNPRDARIRLVLATGIWVSRWRAHEEAVEVAFVDPRTPEERLEFMQLRHAIARELDQTGEEDVQRRFDEGFRPPLPGLVPLAVARLDEIGGPAAVFITPL